MVSPPDVVTPNPPPIAHLKRALPFAISLAMVPLALIGAAYGGWTILLLPLFGWGLFALLDLVFKKDTTNEDPATDEKDLFWFRLLTMIWVPIQFLLVFGLVGYVSHAAHLGLIEKIGLFLGIGVMTGLVGMVYAHELVHRNSRLERWLGDILLAMTLYSHVRTERLKVHDLHVGTLQDPATARPGEDFYRYFQRVLAGGHRHAWEVEAEQLKHMGRPLHSLRNPFWVYGALQIVMVGLALALGGAQGLLLFLVQAFVAVCQLELLNFVGHYGLTRRILPDGTPEPVMPHHSWNADGKASNRLLINLQRHSDHHAHPERRYPLLQALPEQQAPQLPHGFLQMAALALFPKVWHSRMNPRLLDWRKTYYPDVTDWAPLDSGPPAAAPAPAEPVAPSGAVASPPPAEAPRVAAAPAAAPETQKSEPAI
ncbi:alkane 1-monooxygenase [Cereibacter azotoformans]|uniref:Alkane 1-monooxygenase n=1 Tax=Cereibacter azotoformans TaxID=43057 RepID=A0A2T5KE97_9RHOB|nr:alkane 1-monooxygenase [Cereibacter azotoformans]AXQ92392.1 alkane 1-monooxygenase [Cereibacter sphaeroides]MBO4170040.1 alkane 1-monooxygenase [Cereibacter azotoformans]PTR20697.1 alkane 1-monooxygenase [Cereibacter azotoformans]UIJ30662.1 alkane 1-monooxygenase [Cereibacter azotoformans]